MGVDKLVAKCNYIPGVNNVSSAPIFLGDAHKVVHHPACV